MWSLPSGPVYTVIGVLAALENIIPPVPADTAVALGAFLSTRGVVSAVGVFLVTWVSNVSSAALVYGAAHSFGRPFFKGSLGRRLLKPRRLERLEKLYERHGTWGIFLSRFIPGVRAVVPPFAGVVGLGPARALVPIVVASGIWYGALTYLAATIVSEADEIAKLVGSVNRAALVFAAVLIAAIIVLLFLKRLRVRRESG